MLTFTVPGNPVAQPRHRSAYIAGHIRTYEATAKHQIHAYKGAIQLAAIADYGGLRAIDVPLRIDIDFVYAYSKSLLRKTQPMPRRWKPTKPDADNLIKAVLDALTGCVIKDDNVIVECRSRKMWSSACYDKSRDQFIIEPGHTFIDIRLAGDLG